MGKVIRYIKQFFEESEEELLENIKEAKETIKENESYIKEAESKLKKLKKSKEEPIRLFTLRNISYLILFALIFIGIYYGTLFSISRYNGWKISYKFECPKDMKDVCPECDIIATCIQHDINYDYFTQVNRTKEEVNLYFLAKNQRSETGQCKAELSIESAGKVIHQETLQLGTLKSGEERVYKTKIVIPEGESKFIVKPECIY